MLMFIMAWSPVSRLWPAESIDKPGLFEDGMQAARALVTDKMRQKFQGFVAVVRFRGWYRERQLQVAFIAQCLHPQQPWLLVRLQEREWYSVARCGRGSPLG